MHNGKADVTAGLIFVGPGAGIFMQSRVLLFFSVGVAGAAAMTLVPVTALAMRSEAKSPLPLGILFAASLMIFLAIIGAKAVTESPAYVAPAGQLEEEDGTDLANVDTPPPAYPRHQMESVYSA
ncbi:hypothetical protein QIS74_06777 [Colletotrichum tabaci]|uniref:Uncharacterized protein n=1 Tax=Colletotrichum tabaci TaxID=1209068 RepID=A0AAV9TA71_9PEZI